MTVLAALAAALHLALTAPGGHAPKVNTHWRYTVRATVAKKLVPGRITVEIVDPLGGRHPVEFGKSTKVIRSFRFKGVFRDFIIWPPESRGVPLTLLVTVEAAGKRAVLRYHVVPRA
jgi:hypothetical protein